ncbi:MAG: NAD(P)-dependent oxidoreductase, partial [Candidatus Omnitrophota bacterium]
MDQVLVTGASGFLGRHLCRRLLAEGMKVNALSRKEFTFPGVAYIPADIADPVAIAKIMKEKQFRIVFHLASYFGDKAELADAARQFIQVNIQGAIHVLQAIQPGNSRFVYASTLCVSSAVQWRRPVTEEDSAPGEMYGASKLAGETFTRMFAEKAGVSWIALRYSSIYGPGDTHPYVVPV